MRGMPIVVVLGLLVPLFAGAAEAATVRTLTITTASARPTVAFSAFDAEPMRLFDFDGDGQKEIIAQNDNRYVYVFDSRSGALLAEVMTTYPPGWGARPINGPEAAVMVQGGIPHLIVQNSAAIIGSFRYSPTEASKFNFVKVWERRLSDCYPNPGSDSKPTLVDLDRDGNLEILALTEEQGAYALRADGQMMWKKCIGGGNGEPAAGDLDGDGWPEAVFPSDGGVLTAADGRTGATRWTFWAGNPAYNLGSASMPVGPTLAQLDGVGGLDVLVGARDSHDCTTYANNHAALFAVSGNGRLLWMRQENTSNPLTYTHPMVHDVDDDGQQDVIWGDWNTQGHLCGDWEVTGPAHVYRYDAAGNLRWTQTLGTFWSNKDLALADVDDDGVQEVLVNGPSGGQDGIWYLDSRTGAREGFASTWPWKVTRGPLVEDLWGKGTMQWVVPVYAYGPGTTGGAIQVFDTGVPYDAAWPHLPDPTRPPPLPPPSLISFDATFTIAAPNPWWQEVYVQPATPRTITRVEVAVADGPWLPMTRATWGAWTTSVHTPAGTRVGFLATDSGGAQSQSLPFVWLDGTYTRGSQPPQPPPPPPPPPFDAGFEVPPGAGEWWVEVKVRTGDPLSRVEAQVDGGAWRALDKTSWGTWAKSFFVARGSSVVFRATNAYDQVATSEPMSWLLASGFSATFTPRSQANNWWVEVKVDSASPIVAVDARIDGGAWFALPATNWLTWAKSVHVLDGQMVQFRARNDVGNTALSTSYRWG